MLNPFPDLLVYSLLAPFILRVGAAAAFAGIAYILWKRVDELSKERFQFGLHGAWLVWLAIFFSVGVAVALLLGYGTQWAALLGALLSIKGAFWAKRYPRFFPLCRAEYLLILVICLSLLLSGAGRPAFDIPL